MKFLCVSAANIEPFRNNSASVRTCEMMAEMVKQAQPGADVEVLPLIDYEMKPCRMCGRCVGTLRCARDWAFNEVFEKMTKADALLVVVPHYAPFPSKLMILLEKLEEMLFLGWCKDEQNFKWPMNGKPLGLVGHGGQTAPEAVEYYKNQLVEPLAAAFGACGFKVVGAGEVWPKGVAFGIRSFAKLPDSVFFDIQHNWDEIAERVKPLVHNVCAAAASQSQSAAGGS